MTKRKIWVKENVSDAIDGHSIGEAINRLEELKAKYGNDATLDIGTESYPYDDNEYPRVFIAFQRDETDQEEAHRLEQEEIRKRQRRVAYEALKKEFEP